MAEGQWRIEGETANAVHVHVHHDNDRPCFQNKSTLLPIVTKLFKLCFNGLHGVKNSKGASIYFVFV